MARATASGEQPNHMAATGILPTELQTRLAERTLELCDIASESGAERDIAEHVLAVLSAGEVPVRDAGDTCVLAGVTSRGERPLVLLAGHLDTVPAQGNRPGRQTGTHVEALGSSDMKGGVAVMLHLALELRDSELDVGYVFFGREELPSAQGALTPLLAREPGLGSADLAIVLEPTANTVQAGCLGNIDAVWSFRGRAGHSARPWLADNAIDRAVAGIQALHAHGPSRREIDGLEFAQVASVTMLHAGVAPNVIPGECHAGVNFRYRPDTGPAQAERTLRARCEPYGTLEVLSNSPGARPPHENALMERLLERSGAAVQPKQAWTPVAELAAAGIEGVNFGPGDPAYAHRADERVSLAALTQTYTMLEGFLCA